MHAKTEQVAELKRQLAAAEAAARRELSTLQKRVLELEEALAAAKVRTSRRPDPSPTAALSFVIRT